MLIKTKKKSKQPLQVNSISFTLNDILVISSWKKSKLPCYPYYQGYFFFVEKDKIIMSLFQSTAPMNPGLQ
jgi:hypothetical protein